MPEPTFRPDQSSQRKKPGAALVTPEFRNNTMTPAAVELRKCRAVDWTDAIFTEIEKYLTGESDGDAIVQFVQGNVKGHLYYNQLAPEEKSPGSPARTPDIKTAMQTYFQSIGVVEPEGLSAVEVPNSLE